MSIASRITSMQEHIGDIYDTLELGGADLTNTNKNLVNIEPILKQKYLDYMNNGTQEIWNNWEKVTGTGSDLKLNNTVQAPMDVTVKGNSEQVQYSGKNLLPIIPTESKTLNGITLTSNGDGSFTVNGTATESASILFDLITPVHLPNQTIYVHLRNPSISDCAMIFIGSGRQSTPGLNAVNRIMTSSNLIDMELTKIGINVDMGKTVNITFTPSLELTDTVTEYEPYVRSEQLVQIHSFHLK